MHITLSPRLVSVDDDAQMGELIVERQSQSLIINGQSFDFGVIPNGATLPGGQVATGCAYVSPVAPIERDDDGVLHITLILPHAADAPEAARFPAPIINPPDGPVTLPQTNWPPAPHQAEQGGDDASN